jgi:hypothetical protein
MSPPEDRFARELGSLLKSAASTFDDVKESVLRGGQASKATLDAQLLKRQRDKALGRLGEVLLDEHGRGVPLPAACIAVVDEIRALDGQIERARAEAEKLWRADARGPAPSTSQRTADDDENDDDDG